MLFLSSILLSGLIIALGIFQGRRCFGGYDETSAAVEEMSTTLASCAEGISFKEVLSGWRDDEDPIVRRITHSLTRLFTKEPLRLHGRLGWVVDLEALCDAKYWAHRHRGYGALESMPGILTGAGILFTFLGLTVGVYGLDPTNSEELTSGVQRLLGGMSMAFLTSIAGVGTALWWTWANKKAIHQFEEAFANLSDVLHDKPFLLIPEEMNYELLDLTSDKKEVLENLGKEIAESMHKMLDEAGLLGKKDEKKATEEIGPVLAKIESSLAHIARGHAESSEINRKLNVYLNKLVRKEAAPTAAEVAANPEHLVRETGAALANLGKINQVQGDTIESLTAATEEFRRLMGAMQTAGSDIARHHAQLSEQFGQLDQHWKSYRNQLHNLEEGLKHTMATFGKELDGSLTKTHDQFDGIMGKSMEHFTKAMQDFDATIQSFSMVAGGEKPPQATEEAAPAGRRRGLSSLKGRNK